MKKTKWMRPDQVKTFRTNDPKKMLGKYLPKNVHKKWTDEWVDRTTGETYSIERSEIITTSGEITQDKLQEIMFAIQTGDIEDVEVCNYDIMEMKLNTPDYMSVFMVEIPIFPLGGHIIKNHFVVSAQDIPQAIRIAAEFGQMHRGFYGKIRATKCVTIDAYTVPDDHECIPEPDRTPAYERKDYFKVQVRNEWVENGKLKQYDSHYIIAAKDVGQAKERIACLLDIQRAESIAKGATEYDHTIRTIRKAVPFNVDCVVPVEFSRLYYTKQE